jgi:hypothetical protein
MVLVTGIDLGQASKRAFDRCLITECLEIWRIRRVCAMVEIMSVAQNLRLPSGHCSCACDTVVKAQEVPGLRG